MKCVKKGFINNFANLKLGQNIIILPIIRYKVKPILYVHYKNLSKILNKFETCKIFSFEHQYSKRNLLHLNYAFQCNILETYFCQDLTYARLGL